MDGCALNGYAVDGCGAWAALGVCGLLVGSFLNVVIHRLPIMAARGDHGKTGNAAGARAGNEAARFDLSWPPSSCPACGRRLRICDNVPVLSFLALGGRCAGCRARIPVRYPLVGALGAALPLAIGPAFAGPEQVAGGAVFAWFAIAIAAIGIETGRIPGGLARALLAAGLLAALPGLFVGPAAAVLGAAAGYAGFRLAGRAGERLWGRRRLCAGDATLAAALGAWLGAPPLPAVLLLAAALRGAVFLVPKAKEKAGRDGSVAFGPFLMIAGLVALVWR